VEVGAIVIVEAESGGVDGPCESAREHHRTNVPVFLLELLGQSILERQIEQFIAAGIRATALLVHPAMIGSIPTFRRAKGNVTMHVAERPLSSIAQVLQSYSRDGIDCALIAKPNMYMEPDLPELLDFHCDGSRAVTRARDGAGALDLWVMDCETEAEPNEVAVRTALMEPGFLPASYFGKGYVKRISELQHCRELVTDAMFARCHMRPFGRQIRPGVWADEGVQIHGGARVVGPAYLGGRCVIGESALVTRCSNIESGSCIDYGTAVEDSSVLSNTYVGMWLDLRHSVVYGDRLLNMERGVLVEISDPNLLRVNVPKGSRARKLIGARPETLPGRRPLTGTSPVRDSVQSINTTTEFES
jgi:NDP-sugar pyrophosphorylase family protein